MICHGDMVCQSVCHAALIVGVLWLAIATGIFGRWGKR